jgi:hypothetical protein
MSTFFSGLPFVSFALPAKALVLSATTMAKSYLMAPTQISTIYNDIGISFFGPIVIAAIFGTSILRATSSAIPFRYSSPNPSQNLLTSAAVGPAPGNPTRNIR